MTATVHHGAQPVSVAPMPKHNPKNFPHLIQRAEKTNPHGETCEPAIARRMAGIHWRCLVRDVIRTRSGAFNIEAEIGRFAPSQVRGDYVPTIAEAYDQMIRIVNGGAL